MFAFYKRWRKSSLASDLDPESEGCRRSARLVEVPVQKLELRDTAIPDGLEPWVTLEGQVDVTL